MAFDSIYLDLDGVLVDLHTAMARRVGVDAALMYGPLNNHWGALPEVFEHATGEEWDQERIGGLFEEWGHDFWARLPKYPWCDELYELCRSTAPTVIMTSPGQVPSSASGKMQWIRDNLPDVERFAITPCKHELAHPNTLLIDDSTEFCEKFTAHGGIAYLFPQPWSDPAGWAERDALAEIRDLFARLSAS